MSSKLLEANRREITQLASIESGASSRLPASVAQLHQIIPAPAIADGAECDNNLTHRVTAQRPASLDPPVVPLPPYFWLYTGSAEANTIQNLEGETEVELGPM